MRSRVAKAGKGGTGHVDVITLPRQDLLEVVPQESLARKKKCNIIILTMVYATLIRVIRVIRVIRGG